MNSVLFVFPFAILWLGILIVLYGRITVGTAFTAFSLIGFAYLGRIDVLAIIPIGLLSIFTFLTTYFHNEPKSSAKGTIYKISFALTILLSFAIAMHAFTGFNNPIIASNTQLSSDSPPFTLYWNIDKTFVAFCLVLVYVSINQYDAIPRKRMFRNGVLSGILVLFITLSIAWGTGLVRWEPKLPDLFVWWFVGNLFITCVAEEVFFRGIIQYQLEQSLKALTRYAWLIALVISGLLFGIAHYAQGPLYVMVAIIAGCGYGLVYYVTKKIEASILTHLLLNAIHFLMFSYPMYRPSLM